MVRLRREIEGVRVHHAVPVPSYALDPEASAAVLPWLDDWLRAREPGRLLLAGAPRTDLALALARAGHWVTLSDVDDKTQAALQARLTPQEASRLTLVDRGYGEAAFAPSSFDVVALFDTLHTYHEPQWLAHKAARELKVDGLFAVRALVHGDAAARPELGAASGQMPRVAEASAGKMATALEGLLRSQAAPLAAGAAAREAVERGAHLQAARFAPELGTVLDAVASALSVETCHTGHTLRLRLCDALFGLREGPRQLVRRALRHVPAEATPDDLRATGPRVVAVVARRALGLRRSTP